MSIAPEDFLQSAKEISSDKASLEVDFRTAISRAYYSAFHVCKSVINENQYENMGTHEQLITSMLESGDKKIEQIGLQLRKCKLKRHKADYKLEQNIFVGETQQVIAECERIISSISHHVKQCSA